MNLNLIFSRGMKLNLSFEKCIVYDIIMQFMTLFESKR